MPADIGPKQRVAVLEAAKDDLAVEVSLWMKRNGVRLRDLRRDYGISQRRLREISLWLRGAPQSRIGHVGALQLAERIGVPTEVVTGEEAVAFREFRAQREAGQAVAA